MMNPIGSVILWILFAIFIGAILFVLLTKIDTLFDYMHIVGIIIIAVILVFAIGISVYNFSGQPKVNNYKITKISKDDKEEDFKVTYLKGKKKDTLMISTKDISFISKGQSKICIKKRNIGGTANAYINKNDFRKLMK